MVGELAVAGRAASTRRSTCKSSQASTASCKPIRRPRSRLRSVCTWSARWTSSTRPGGAGLCAVSDAVSRRAALGGGRAAGAVRRALRQGPGRQAVCALRQGRPNLGSAATVGADAGRVGSGAALVLSRRAWPVLDSPVRDDPQSAAASVLSSKAARRSSGSTACATAGVCDAQLLTRGDLVAIQQLLGHWTVSLDDAVCAPPRLLPRTPIAAR